MVADVSLSGHIGCLAQATQKKLSGAAINPFAKYDYIDDIACFDASLPSENPSVYYIHMFATPGWENRGNVIDFNAWLQAALEDARRDKEGVQ